MKADAMEFRTHYSDGSGTEFAVRYNGDDWVIQFEAIGQTVDYPAEKIDWLINALDRIRDEMAED